MESTTAMCAADYLCKQDFSTPTTSGVMGDEFGGCNGEGMSICEERVKVRL